MRSRLFCNYLAICFFATHRNANSNNFLGTFLFFAPLFNVKKLASPLLFVFFVIIKLVLGD